MKKIEANVKEIEEFNKKIKYYNDELKKVLEDMKKDSILYEDMVDNKAGNLYKEVMQRELNKEIERVDNNSILINDKITYAISKYREFIREVGMSTTGRK